MARSFPAPSESFGDRYSHRASWEDPLRAFIDPKRTRIDRENARENAARVDMTCAPQRLT
jgi:hypothetical protein